MVLPLLASCGGGNSAVGEAAAGGNDIPMTHSRFLTLSDHGDYITATIRNPWDTTRLLHTYHLVPDSVDMPDALPPGTVVKTPLRHSLVASSIHSSLIDEMGAAEAIGGVFDAAYINDRKLSDRIRRGDVADCGLSHTPDVERVMQLRPDALLLSPFENSGSYDKLGLLGIPIIECADYMETSPLARAEWMRFYGLLFGREKKANEMFEVIEKEYTSLKERVATTSGRPKVIVDRLYGGSWHVPASNSTMGLFIKDAGGTNPFAAHQGTGSVALSAEEVLYEAGDADFWLIRYSQGADKTLKELAADNAIYSQFDAFRKQTVYGCNTTQSFFYETVPFHPHLFLRELAGILHPELGLPAPDSPLFSKMNP